MNVLEENDEKPVCTPDSYFLAIPVDLQVGTNIQNFKLTCTDLDSSPQSFRYSIGSGTRFPRALSVGGLSSSLKGVHTLEHSVFWMEYFEREKQG